MDDMLETMYQAPGIGLAAPQVGVLKRVIVLDLAREGEDPQPLRLANPEVVCGYRTTTRPTTKAASACRSITPTWCGRPPAA